MDSSGQMLLVGPQWHEITGWSAAELLGKKWLGLIPENNRTAVQSTLQAIVTSSNPTASTLSSASTSDTSHTFTHRIRCKDASHKWLAWTIRPLSHAELIIGQARDITAQTLQNRQRELDAIRLERAVRGMQEGLWEWDIVTDETFVSARFKELLGFADDELPSDKTALLARIHPDDLQRALELPERGKQHSVTYDLELRMLPKTGDYRWYRSRGLIEWDARGEPVRQTGCLSDITQRKLAEQRQHENDQRLNFALEATEFGDWSMDISSNVLVRSLQHDRCFGYDEPPAVWNYKSFMDHIHPDDRAMVHEEYVGAMKGKGDFDVEMRVVWPDQTTHWLWSKGRFYFDRAGQLERVAGFVVEITKKRLEEIALAETEGRYKLLFDNNLDGIIQTTVDSEILAANPAACAILGASESTLIQCKSRRFVDEDDDRHAAFAEALYRDGNARGNVLLRRLDGSRFDADVSSSVYKDFSQKTILSFTFRDVTAQKKAEAAIHQLAFYDPLTGLANRRLLIDRMRQLLASTKRTECISSVFFIDLDFFKSVNDARGHAVGDVLLKMVAARLTDLLRDGDTVARIGGDEFVVLATNLSSNRKEGIEQAELVAEKIRAAMCLPFVIDDAGYNLGCSIGITLLTKDDDNADDLLREADTAMYRAKEAGRNRVMLYEPGMHKDALEHLSLKNDVLNALSRNEISMHIQPQVDHSGNTIGAELLMRWHHPRRGMISPATFIPMAEQTGAILALGDFALDYGCRLIVRLAQAGRPLPISINISPRQFKRDDFAQRIFQVLEQTGATASSLVLELTEGLLIDNIDSTIKMMTTLADAGVRFSIDDFGTGYSSLAYIRRLPLHELKIDRSFVKSIPADADETAIVQTITAMAKNLDLRVVAEGVETIEQAQFLIAAGCDAMQGYLYSRPMDVEQWLMHHLTS